MKATALLVIIGLIISLSILFPIQNQTDAKNVYPYSIEENSPALYLEKTMQNKTTVWFEFKEDKWRINWDAERLPFDKIFVHYAENQSIEEMNDLFKTFYINRFNSSNNDPYVKGLEPHSGHVFNEKETYLVYHYIIYEDGKTVQTLNPLIKIEKEWYIDQVAWHAGNWTDNCRSISVCLVNNDSNMSKAQLESLSSLIQNLKKINPNLQLHNYTK
ncbi:MAG TPA: hypothetical protein DCS12_00695 [Clostridiales bacterium]|nr:hypothetical protein [Clostridiales bacterium]